MDSGDDGLLSYTIHSGNVNDVFSINHRTGELVLAKSLDYESATSYQLTLCATDQPSSDKDNSKTSQTNLSISILDVNDNAPHFSEEDSKNCRKFISDDTMFGTQAFSIQATDLDTSNNAELTYSVDLQDKDSGFLDLFSLDPSTGVFTVKDDLSLDKSFPKGRELTFKYISKDSGIPSLSTEIQCSVLITGENKHAPRLEHPAVVTVVTSSIYIGHQVTSIKASDADSGPDGTLQFTISTGNDESVFKISEETGKITLENQPEHGYYSFNVKVSDKASIGKRKTIFCTVHVYFSALPIKNIDNVVIGDVIENKKRFTVKKDEKMVLPITLQLALNNLEGFDIEIIVVEGDVAEIGEVVSSQYEILRASSTAARILGLTDPNKNIFGVHQIGEVTLLPISSGSVNIDIKVLSLVSQELKDITSGVPMDLEVTECDNHIGSPNIISTCKLDLNDAIFIQSYLRQKENGFIGSLGKTLQSISSTVKSAMDTDQNGVVNNQDAELLFDSLLGKALTIKEMRLAQPGTVDENKEKCDIHIEAKTSFNGFDVSAYKIEDFDVYLLLSYNTNELIDQTKSSNLKILSSSSSSIIEGDMKYVEAVKMNRSSTTRGTFTLTSKTSAIQLKNIGLSLIIRNKKTSFHATTMIKHPSSTSSDVIVMSFEGIDVSVHAQDRPQVKHNIETTTSRCMNPLHTMRMRMKLDGDFDAYVAEKEDEFKSEFKIYLQTHLLQKHGHTIVITNVAVSKGSVVLQFDLQHEADDGEDIVSSIVEDLGTNQITMPFQGLDYPAQSTLIVDDQEQVVRPVAEKENPMSKAFIAIGVIFGLALIFGFIGVLYLCKKRDDPYQQAKEKKGDFERKLSDGIVAKDKKFPTMASHAKNAGVVNNAYEYFKTLDHSGAHTPNTKHVVNSLRKQPDLDLDQQRPNTPTTAPTTPLEQTRSSLRRRNTPKNLEEMQEELRVRNLRF